MIKEYSCHGCRKMFESEAPCKLACELLPGEKPKLCAWGDKAAWGGVGARGHTLKRIMAEDAAAKALGDQEHMFVCQANDEDGPTGCKRGCVITVRSVADLPDNCILKNEDHMCWCRLRAMHRRESEVV